jgi:hypothetical protein
MERVRSHSATAKSTRASTRGRNQPSTGGCSAAPSSETTTPPSTRATAPPFMGTTPRRSIGAGPSVHGEHIALHRRRPSGERAALHRIRYVAAPLLLFLSPCAATIADREDRRRAGSRRRGTQMRMGRGGVERLGGRGVVMLRAAWPRAVRMERMRDCSAGTACG